MTSTQLETDKEFQNDDWSEYGLLYLFDKDKIILLLTGEASLPTLFSNFDGMPSTKTLRRWLDGHAEPRKQTLIKYMKSLIQFLESECLESNPEIGQKYYNLLGIPHDFIHFSRQEQETIIESLEPKIQHPWDEVIILLQTHGERFKSTCKLIQDLIDAEIKTLEYMQERLSDIEEVSDISDEILVAVFLEAISFSFENDGFRTTFNFLYEPLGLTSPKKHNKTLLDVFSQNIDRYHPQNILNILKYFRLNVFSILAGIFQSEYSHNKKMVSAQHSPHKREVLSDYIAPFADYPHSDHGRLKKQSKLERKLTSYILQDYRPFDLFIKYLMKTHNFSKNKLAHFLPGKSDLEHKQRKLDKWCQYRAWGEKKGDPYNVKDMLFLLNEIDADNDTRIIFDFMIFIDQIYIPQMITLPQKAWKDLYP